MLHGRNGSVNLGCNEKLVCCCLSVYSALWVPDWRILGISIGIIKRNSPLYTSRVFHASLTYLVSEYRVFDLQPNICSESHTALPAEDELPKQWEKTLHNIFINVHSSDSLTARSRSPHFTPYSFFFFYPACFASSSPPLVVSDSRTVFLTVDRMLMFHRQTV